MFDEWWVDPVKLVRANLRAAESAGAKIVTHAAIEGLLRDGRAVRGVTVRAADGRPDSVEARVVVNAAGPWVERVAGLAGVDIPLRLQKGTHLVYDGPPPVATRVGLLLEAEDRARYVFIVPGPGLTLVGPTDVATGEDPDHLASSAEEVRYLLGSVRRYFRDFPERFSRTSVGARPILGQAGSEKQLSREFQVLDHGARDGVPGLVTIAGGKMSDFRLMAEETGNAVGRILGNAAACRSHLETLDGTPVAGVPPSRPPSPLLKNFLRFHPRLREAHAFAYLAAGYLRHAARRLTGLRSGGDPGQYGL
jgi:glycerol-3-phosphate dehydrogenase